MIKIASAQIRVSTKGQFQSGDSPKTQKEEIIAKAAKFTIEEIELSIKPEQIEFFTLPESSSVPYEQQPFQKVLKWHKENPKAKYHLLKLRSDQD